jgi:hypothetical protein
MTIFAGYCTIIMTIRILRSELLFLNPRIISLLLSKTPLTKIQIMRMRFKFGIQARIQKTKLKLLSGISLAKLRSWLSNG